MAMELDMILVLLVAGSAVVLFLTERLRVDLIALLILLALTLGGQINPAQALAGFSSPAVVIICSIYVMSLGLYRAGIANWLGRKIVAVAGKGEMPLLIGVMVVTASLSFFMNTIGIVALMLPVVMDLGRRTGCPPSQLLMPLSYAGLLGGLTSLFATTTNLLVSQSLKDANLEPFGLLDFIPVGGAAALAGMVFLVVVGRRWLPDRDMERESSAAGGLLQRNLNVGEQLFTVRLPRATALAGKSLEESRLGSALGLHVLGVVRAGKTFLTPSAEFRLKAGDEMLVQASADQFGALESWQQLRLGETLDQFRDFSARDVHFAEVAVSSGSQFEGKSLALIGFRQQFGLTVLAVRRGRAVRRSNLRNWELQAGDTLLVHGRWEGLEALKSVAGFESYQDLSEADLQRTYRMEERLFTLELLANSPLEGKTLGHSRLGDALGFAVLAISRNEQLINLPGLEEVLGTGDRLLVAGRSEDLLLLRGLKDLQVERRSNVTWRDLESEGEGLAEVVLAPRCTLVGKSLREISFRDKFGLTVLAIWREGQAHTHNLREMVLRFGDALLLLGSRDKLRLLAQDPDFIALNQNIQEAPRYNLAPRAIMSVLLFLVPALAGWLRIEIAALVGAVCMVLTRCLTMDQACKAVDLKTILLIGGMTSLGIAMDQSGAAAQVALGLVGSLKAWGSVAVLSGVFLITSLACSVMPAAAVVLLMAPIALRTAVDLQLSPHAVMMVMAMAAAGSFNSPVAHPANMLIMGPGGYRFSDYLRIGIPLSLVVLVVVLVVMPFFWPIQLP